MVLVAVVHFNKCLISFERYITCFGIEQVSAAFSNEGINSSRKGASSGSSTNFDMLPILEHILLIPGLCLNPAIIGGTTVSLILQQFEQILHLKFLNSFFCLLSSNLWHQLMPQWFKISICNTFHCLSKTFLDSPDISGLNSEHMKK